MSSPTHTSLGDVALPVGHYTKGGEKKYRRRQLGTLMRTSYPDGTERLWIKIHADVLNPSLLILASRNQIMQPGDDSIIASVYADDARSGAAEAPAPADQDGI